jgi:hypothetical protein
MAARLTFGLLALMLLGAGVAYAVSVSPRSSLRPEPRTLEVPPALAADETIGYR